jgi:hypothetical protein
VTDIQQDMSAAICQDYLQGKCKAGDKCCDLHNSCDPNTLPTLSKAKTKSRYTFCSESTVDTVSVQDSHIQCLPNPPTTLLRSVSSPNIHCQSDSEKPEVESEDKLIWPCIDSFVDTSVSIHLPKSCYVATCSTVTKSKSSVTRATDFSIIDATNFQGLNAKAEPFVPTTQSSPFCPTSLIFAIPIDHPSDIVSEVVPSDSLVLQPSSCTFCNNGEDYSQCVIPKCKTCCDMTQCLCGITTCLCVNCNSHYPIPICGLCNSNPTNIATQWTKCLQCLKMHRQIAYKALVDSSVFNTTNMINMNEIIAVTSRCYTCRDGRDVSACIIPFFEGISNLRNVICDIKGHPIPGGKLCSSKIICIECKTLHNRPLCLICSRLGDTFSAYQYCDECTYLTTKLKQLKYNDLDTTALRYKRQIFVKHAYVFKPEFMYVGRSAFMGCGMCHNGRYMSALNLSSINNTLKAVCMFCNGIYTNMTHRHSSF